MDNPSSANSSAEQSASALQTAKVHHAAIKIFLESYLAKEQNGISAARQSAREKLTRLFAHQFEELSTDVYDEMNRRIGDESIPFLPVQAEFHPKRNQARQKLATLSSSRFKDLASDVYHELERRYPTLKNNVSLPRPQSVQSKAPPIQITSSSTASRPVSHIPPKEDDKGNAITNPSVNNEKDPFGVNFQTLDNLMADLGNMIATSLDEPKTEPNIKSKEAANEEERVLKPVSTTNTNSVAAGTVTIPTTGPTVQSTNIAKESQNQILINDLKNENERMKEEKSALLLEVEKLKSDQVKIQSELQKTIHELSMANDEKERIIRDNAEHQANLRNEIENLRKELSESNPEPYIREIESLTVAIKEAEGERELLQQTIKNLENDKAFINEQLSKEQNTISVLRTEMESMRKELENMKNSTVRAITTSTETSPHNPGLPPAHPPAVIKDINTNMVDKLRFTDKLYFSDQGFVHNQHVSDFQSSINELIRASKVDTPAAVLIAMKSIVVATRNISDSVERFERTSNSPLTVEKAQGMRSDISSHLTNLMTAAKNHATGNSGPEGIETCANELVDDVVNIVKTIKIAKPLSMDNLKSFLEQQTDLIVQNIQILLQEMRQSAFGVEFRQTINNITTVVDNLIQVSKASLDDTTYKDPSDAIINNLGESNAKLGELGEHMLGERKPSKQKLAAAAYEVAKYTKELVSLFDLDKK